LKIVDKTTLRTQAVLPVSQAPQAFFDEVGLDPADYEIVYSPEEQTEIRRRDLAYSVGDVTDLLDSVSDAAGIALAAIATLSKSLATATTLTELKTAMAPYAPALTAFIDKADAGDTVLPFKAKGTLDEVLGAVSAVATRVSEVQANPVVRPGTGRGRS
jgi:hypothetical protein